MPYMYVCYCWGYNLINRGYKRRKTLSNQSINQSINAFLLRVKSPLQNELWQGLFISRYKAIQKFSLRSYAFWKRIIALFRVITPLITPFCVFHIYFAENFPRKLVKKRNQAAFKRWFCGLNHLVVTMLGTEKNGLWASGGLLCDMG